MIIIFFFLLSILFFHLFQQLRRSRSESIESERRNRRGDQLAKRRMIDYAIEDTETTEDTENTNTEQPSMKTKSTLIGSITLSRLPEFAAGLSSEDPQTVFNSVAAIRKLLSKEKKPPVDQVIEAGCVPYLVHFLGNFEMPSLQFEAAWALTNIASGTRESTNIVINNNAIPAIISCLSSPSEELREQSVWCLGNIAGEGCEHRDFLLNEGAFEKIVYTITTAKKDTTIANGVWALSNLCRGKNPHVNFDYVRPHLDVLANIIATSTDISAISDACWALSYLTDSDAAQIQEIIDTGVVSHLIRLLSHPNESILTPTIRCIGNILTGNEEQTQLVIDSNGLACLRHLLFSPKEATRKEICWCISNAAAGSLSQVQAVQDYNIIPPLIEIIKTKKDKSTKEAGWAILNFLCGGSNAHIKYAVDRGCIPVLCELLDIPDNRFLETLLDGFEKVLQCGEQLKKNSGSINRYADYVEEAGGMEKIEQLQNHANNTIYEKANKIIVNYFSGESEAEDVSVAPQVNTQTGTFSFGLSSINPVAATGGFKF